MYKFILRIHTSWLSRLLASSLLLAIPWSASAETIGCVTTAWKLIGANHKVCVEAFHDPKVPGVTLAISRKLIDGAPANSISTVPVMPWAGRP